MLSPEKACINMLRSIPKPKSIELISLSDVFLTAFIILGRPPGKGPDMPYAVDQDWYLPTHGAETLRDLAFRASVNAVGSRRIPASQLNNLPKELKFDFHEITNATHTPSVMRLRKINDANEPSELNVAGLFDGEIGYDYLDEYHGFTRYNLLSNQLHMIRAEDNIRVNGEFTSRSYLVGSEYSRTLLDFFA